MASEEFDLFGITIVGLAMAFDGGVTPDLLVARVPLALQFPIELTSDVFGVLLAIVLSVVIQPSDEQPITVVADAIGLVAFATTGTTVATEANLLAFGIVTIATIDTVGGGAVADILLNCSPFLLFEDFCASCGRSGRGSVLRCRYRWSGWKYRYRGLLCRYRYKRLVAVTRTGSFPQYRV